MNNNAYYNDLLRIIAMRLEIDGYDYKAHDELKKDINNIDKNIVPLFEDFKAAYDEYSDYFNKTYKDLPFTKEESEEYNRLSDKMNSIRDQILQKLPDIK